MMTSLFIISVSTLDSLMYHVAGRHLMREVGCPELACGVFACTKNK